MPKEGVEPSRISALGFESSVSTVPPLGRESCDTPCRIRTDDIQLERLADWATILTEQVHHGIPENRTLRDQFIRLAPSTRWTESLNDSGGNRTLDFRASTERLTD